MALTERTTTDTAIDGLVLATMKQVSDGRGTVREFYRESDTHGDSDPFPVAQVNITRTHYGAIRGFHGEAMRKIVGVIAGEALGAYLDARPGSATFGLVETVPLEPGLQVIVPNGVLNAFQCLSDQGCEYLYAFDAEWCPTVSSVGVHPLDPDLGLAWPVPINPSDRALLSEKDAALPSLRELLSN